LRKLSWLLTPLLTAVLLGSTLGPATAAAAGTSTQLDPSLKIHPLLQKGAETHPLRSVRVIAQTTTPDALKLVKGLADSVPGVQIGEQFNVLPAFVATLPQASVPLLAKLPTVRYISPDGGVQVLPGLPLSLAKAAKPKPAPPAKGSKTVIDSSNLVTQYPFDMHATDAWSPSDGHAETGSNVNVAVIDSGADVSHPDLAQNVTAVNTNPRATTANDGYGHGTHVAGIVAGRDGAEHYLGVAPEAHVYSVKVADDNGGAYESDLLRGLDWVEANRGVLHLRALNLSVSVTMPESYATSPVDAAVERLWSEGVAVVASSGNLGDAQDAVWYAPGNDPFIITVGCVDDNATVSTRDDSLCPISSRGVTEDGFAKPDLVAPGRKIVSALASGIGGQGTALAQEFPDRITDDGHIRLSGTSMSAPMVTGAIALLLQRHDGLRPAQLKQILTASAVSYPGQPDKAGELNIAAALAASDHPPAPDKIQGPLPVGASTATTGSVGLIWNGARWGNAYWDGARWGSSTWDGARWGNANWD